MLDGAQEGAAWTESSPLSDIQLVRRLTHPETKKRLVVRPLIDPGQIGGTTIDVRLGTEWEVLRTSRFRRLIQEVIRRRSRHFLMRQ